MTDAAPAPDPALTAARSTAAAIRAAIDAGALPSAIALGVEQLRALAPEARGPVLTALAVAYANHGQAAEALRTAAAARDLARERGDIRLEVDAIMAIAVTLGSAEDHAGVISHIETAEPLIAALGDDALRAQALRRIGVSCSILGESARALDYLTQSRQIVERLGLDDEVLSLQNSIFNAHARRLEALPAGDPARTAGNLALLDDWLQLAERQQARGLKRLALMSRGNYAICAWRCGRAEDALAELDRLLAQYAAAGMGPNVAITHNHRGHALRQLGRLPQAQAAYEAALTEPAISLREQREAWEGLAAVAEAGDDARAALAALKRAREIDLQLTDAQARRQAEQRELRLELARLADHWSRLASEDALTGLPNRRALDAWLPAALARAAAGQPLALLLVDVDHFKRVNDRHGHALGDAVLRALAGLLRARCRYDDLPVRLGGEEFVLALPATTLAQAVEAAQRLREAVAAHDWSAIAAGLRVTVSIGVAASDAPGTALAGDSLLVAADRHLYAAKRGGRNRVAAEATLP